MRESFANWLSSHGLAPEWIVIIVSMLPIFELRGGIPCGFLLNLAWWKTYLLSVLGNIIPVVPILLLLEPISNWLRSRVKSMDRFFEWLFARTRKRTEGNIRKYGVFLGLMLFVAIPFPLTGAWTGCIAAFIFGIKFRLSLPAVLLGVLIASIVVSMVTYGTATVLSLF